MEKRKPTYDLSAFQSAARRSKGLLITSTASRTAFELGFNRSGIVDAILSMRGSHFVKSMTSNADHAVWQDVYTVPSRAGVLYVKFTSGTITEFVLLSFKEKNNE